MSDVQEGAPVDDHGQAIEPEIREEEVKPVETEAAAPVQPEKTAVGASHTSLPTVGAMRGSANNAAQKDVSVATVVRLMGLPTAAELRIVEQKIDTLTTRLTAMGQKLDRIAGAVQSSSDVDSVQVQIADVKRLVKELMTKFEK